MPYKDYFEAIYGDSVGYVPLVTLDDERQPSIQTWLKWPEKKDYFHTYVSLHLDEDVYNSVALYSEKDRTSSDKDAVCRVVFADADACHPSNFRLTPSISVQTSAGRWHCYWVLDNEVAADLAVQASRKIGKAHNLEASSGMATKILRTPGTTNTKHGKEEVTAKYTGEVYTLADINKAYSDIDLAEVATVKDVATPAFLDIEELEARLMSYSELSTLYLQVVPSGGSWSERAYRLQLDLFREGFTAQEVFTLVWNAACNKYHPDHAGMLTESGVPIPKRSNPEDVLWREVCKAQGEYRVETQKVLADTDPSEVEKGFQFITSEERAYLDAHPTFVDEFVDWVGSRSPQSALRYRYSAAYMVLSCVLGDRGYVPARHGRVFLNLWVYTLGGTSSTRKTTVKDLAMEIVENFGDMIGDEHIQIANDFSAEALNAALSPRNGRPSVVVIDEIHGFFDEIGGKGYRAGLKETLTELFNGKVKVALRMKKESAVKKATTVFNMYGIGTDREVAHVLTLSDFSSGFMMRPVYAITDPIRATKEDSYLQLDDGDGTTYIREADAKSYEFAERFAQIHSSLPPGQRMDFTDEAQERFRQWESLMFDLVSPMKDYDYVSPGYERMKVTVLKGAALLALSNERTVVEIWDVVKVLKQTEWWFEDMLRMLRSVAASEFQRQTDEIYKYISSGDNGQRNRANTIRVFSQYRPRQIDEFLDSLIQQGRIEAVRDGNKNYLRSAS